MCTHPIFLHALTVAHICDKFENDRLFRNLHWKISGRPCMVSSAYIAVLLHFIQSSQKSMDRHESGISRSSTMNSEDVKVHGEKL